MNVDTPRTNALLLVINEGRIYEDDGPLAQLCRELEMENRAMRSAYHTALDAINSNRWLASQ